MLWPRTKLANDKNAMPKAAQVIWLGVTLVFANSLAIGSDIFLLMCLEM
jgi:hypothetical protein